MIDTPLQQGGYESSKDALKEFGILIEALWGFASIQIDSTSTWNLVLASWFVDSISCWGICSIAQAWLH